MPVGADCFRYFAGAARTMHALATGEYTAGYTSMVRRDPIGVIGSITPWNYPLMMAIWKLAPALAGGNTVVIKPSENTPLTTLKLAKTIAEIFPEGVVNVVAGRGATVGQALISHPKVAMVSLTGSIATGRKVIEAAAPAVKRTHLELGGKAPVIVFDDADVASVVEGIKTFGYYNAGQDCTAACRIYVGKKVYDNLVADLSAAVKSIKYNLPNDEENEIGPLISTAQRERVQRLRRARCGPEACFRHRRRQRGRGRRLLLRADRRCRRAAVRRDRAAEKCSARSCRSRGSTTSRRPSSGRMTATTGSPHRYGRRTSSNGMATAARLRYGCTWVNTHFIFLNEMPHGGLKASGYGKDLSMYALEDYTVARHVMVKL